VRTPCPRPRAPLPLLATFACALVLLAAPRGAAAAEYEYAKRGHAIAERLCARCHAVERTGESPHKDAPPFRTLAAKWPLEDLEEALAEGIVTGHPDMPPFAFEPDDIAALIDHLHDISESRAETGEQGGDPKTKPAP